MLSNSSGSGPAAGYDPVAEEYAEQFFNELEHKPFDRDLLERFADTGRTLGPVCDIGCGPGQIAHYLHDQGVEVFGVDLSAEMVATAGRLSPAIPFEQGDMRQLPAESGSWGGIAAFYAVIHIPPVQLPQVMQEFHRVLVHEGHILIAYHIGDEIIHLDDWWDKPVDLDFHFFQPMDLEHLLVEADFIIEESLARPPYEEVEHSSQRGYILARKP